MQNLIPKELNKLYRKLDNCERCKAQNNPLRHIFAGGKLKNPKFLFLFINPTHLNFSSHSKYKGERRYPFVGVRYFWKLFSKIGFIDELIVEDIYKNGWKIGHENEIEQNLIKNDVCITNLIKCTQDNPQNPTKLIIKGELANIKKEISLINPQYIVTFGKLPTKTITGVDLRLKDILVNVENNKYKPIASIDFEGKSYKVLPCYFPVGRGNPNKARYILNYIKNNF